MDSETRRLVARVGRLLVAAEQRLSVAESLTGGHVQALLTSVSGASDFFEGGITPYSLDQKVAHLGVDRQLAAACHCVSAEVAQQMAIGVCRLFRVHWGLATTGFAEPDATRGAEMPRAFLAIAQCVSAGHDPRIVKCEKLTPTGSRIEVQQIVAKAAVERLHEQMSRSPSIPLRSLDRFHDN